MPEMTSRERYYTVYRREQPDCVPVRVRGVDPWSRDSAMAKRPGYLPLIEAALARTDLCSSYKMREGVFMSGSDAVKVVTYRRPSEHTGYFERVTEYQTPAGVATRVDLVSTESNPGYTIKHPIENVEDADKFLSIPYVPAKAKQQMLQAERGAGLSGMDTTDSAGSSLQEINRLLEKVQGLKESLTEEKAIEAASKLEQELRAYLNEKNY